MDDNYNTAIYRKKIIDRLVKEIEQEGHYVEEIDLSLGGLPEDFQVDIYPHKQDVHLQITALQIRGHLHWACDAETLLTLFLKKGYN